MFIRRLARGIRGQDWFTVTIELFVVMVGLVAAFQVDRWWEARGDRLNEEMYISRLMADLEEDIRNLEYSVSLAGVRLEFGDFLVDVGSNPSLALERPTYFLAAVSQAAFTYTPSLATHTFEDLRASGNLKLIRDQSVRQALRRYYAFDQTQRQFISLNLMVEFRHFELSAGIITPEQFRFVQDRWYVVNRSNLDQLQGAQPAPGDIAAATDRLRENAEFLAWLPKTRGLQIDQIKANEGRLDNARALLEKLGNYVADPTSSEE
ncbi:MAG: hypothetical protein ACR2QU_01070 [Gammaproteobacteria bacterium]